MKSIRLVLILVAAIATIPASAAERTVSERVARINYGRTIKVELNTGEVLKGRMGSATAEQFNVEPRRRGQGTTRVVRIDEVRSVRPGMGLTGKVAIGVVAGVAAFVVLVYFTASG